jgi:hypothetical protein
LDGLLTRAIAVEEMKLDQLINAQQRLGKNDPDRGGELEREKDTQQLLVNGLEIVSLYGQSFFKRNSRGYWPASTLEDKCYLMFGGWNCLIPDEIGMHSDNVGGYLSYRFQFPVFADHSVDIGFDPLHSALNTDDYASAELLLRRENRNIFVTSVGLGLKLYKTIGERERFVDDEYLGVVGKIGLFSDKLKVTGAYRFFSEDVNFRQRVELTFGISDMKGILKVIFGN